jgi:AcrR family transcriptional regulator
MVSLANASVRARGAATHTRILETAVHIASVEGLAAMSLATLAKATGMSKSGLFAHFRSKVALQIAIIDEAERVFLNTVWVPSREGDGRQRLESLLATYMDYCVRGPFDGGCFFAAAAHEFDGRPGPVRDRISAFSSTWDKLLRGAVADAFPRADLDLVVFQINSTALGVNCATQMGLSSDAARRLGGDAVRALLAGC